MSRRSGSRQVGQPLNGQPQQRNAKHFERQEFANKSLQSSPTFQSRTTTEYFTLEMLAYGGRSPPASISRQGFANKSLQSSPTFQSRTTTEYFTLEMLAYGGRSPPASISRQGFAKQSNFIKVELL
ncbi:MAG: hypothetical protein LBU06_01115 [Desulfovibrio sp.]|jgi:hypothetical protein|nr:hypothetical protein [Desulfovibrio sp.]